MLNNFSFGMSLLRISGEKQSSELGEKSYALKCLGLRKATVFGQLVCLRMVMVMEDICTIDFVKFHSSRCVLLKFLKLNDCRLSVSNEKNI